MLSEVVVTKRYQVTIPKEVREALGIRAGDKLVVRVVNGRILLEPAGRRRALERLSTISDRLLGGPRRVDAVKLVEETLRRETGLH